MKLSSPPALNAHTSILNADSLITAANCASFEAANPNFLKSSQFLDSNIHVVPYLSQHQNPSQIDTVVPSKTYNDRSASTCTSSSAMSLDDITMNESDLDFSLDEDEEFDDSAPTLKDGSPNSKLESPRRRVHSERRKRHGRKPSEGDARYRLECIRERNRVAARKYRQKQKGHVSKLEVEGERLIEERDELMQTVKRLQNEVFHLKHRYINELCWNCGQTT